MSAARIAKLETLLERVITRRDEPRAPALQAITQAPVAQPVAQAPVAVAAAPVTQAPVAVATTPPPPPIAVPEVSVPRQPIVTEDFQESTRVSAESVPLATESHARIADASREIEEINLEEIEAEPISSARAIDPSLEVDAELEPDAAPPQSTRQLTSPPPQTVTEPPSGPVASTPPRAPTMPPASAKPASAPRSAPVVTRGTLPPTAEQMIEFDGAPASTKTLTVGELLDATLSL